MGRIPIQASSATSVTIQGREFLAFGGCNYVGLAHHPEVRLAMRESVEVLGLSTTASRETTGNTTTHEALERELAAFMGFESAILTPEGYTANMALAQTLTEEFAVAVVDSRSHRSVTHALTAAGLSVIPFEHLNAAKAAELVAQHSDRGVVIYTDGVFAADGSIAPVDKLLRALPDHGLLVVDDCHGLCVLGPGGRGTCRHFGVSDDRVCVTTTLGKGLGCYGGAILGPRHRVQRVQQESGVYRGTTPVPPPIAHAARAALRVLEREPSLIDRLRSNTDHMRAGLIAIGLPILPDRVPIFTFALEPSSRMDVVQSRLFDEGLLAPVIEYPGTAFPRFFRITVTAHHTPEQIERLLDALRTAMSA